LTYAAISKDLESSAQGVDVATNLPVRDALSFAVFVASFFGRTVFWRDQVFRVEATGRMTIGGDKTP